MTDDDFFVGEGPPEVPPAFVQQLREAVYRHRVADRLWDLLAETTVDIFEAWRRNV